MASHLSEDSLRLLYLDWCSSQVAKRFLELSLDEVWLRFDSATSALPVDPPTASPSGTPFDPLHRIPDYLDLVRKTALLLAQEMGLPAFPEWKEEYLANPAPFDAEMLGKEK